MLEGWLGVLLFERHNRRVVLTEAGGAYAIEIGAALDRIALATARQAERGRSRLLHVNALATFTLRWLIPRLSGFQLANPSIEVRLTTSNVPLARLAEPFDVAIRGGPDSRPGRRAEPFLSERRIPVCSPCRSGSRRISGSTRCCTRRRSRGSGRTGCAQRACRT